MGMGMEAATETLALTVGNLLCPTPALTHKRLSVAAASFGVSSLTLLTAVASLIAYLL